MNIYHGQMIKYNKRLSLQSINVSLIYSWKSACFDNCHFCFQFTRMWAWSWNIRI